ncbi:hypothetical protein ACEQ8H_006946 [Pleosporales sp. CAS-2024a]
MPPPPAPTPQRHLHVALHHAHLLDARKRVEAAVLDAVMALMAYPTAADADPRQPSATDAHYFRHALQPFQPADYDSLIEERNIDGRCGYALCPRPPRTAPSTARKQFVDTARGVEIVDRRTLEVWCSDDCARRALYVKVQLSEEPAWMRPPGYGDTIELLVENAPPHRTALPLRLKQPAVAADVTKAANNELVKDHITERLPSDQPPPPPSLSAQPSQHTMAIEGHVPQRDQKDNDDDDDEDDDEDDEDDAQDWEKHLPR